MKVGFFLLHCAGTLAVVQGLSGSCPRDVEPAAALNMASLNGVWYEIEKHPSNSGTPARCVTRNIVHLPDGSTKIIDSHINSNNEPQKFDRFMASANADDAQRLFTQAGGAKSAQLWILASDYRTFAVFFACADISVANAKSVQIWARQRNPSPYVLGQAHDILKKYNVGTTPLQKTDQNKC